MHVLLLVNQNICTIIRPSHANIVRPVAAVGAFVVEMPKIDLR